MFEFGSNVELLTLALLLIVAPGKATTFTVRVTVAEPPEFNVPIVHWTLPLLPAAGEVHEPCEVVTEENVVPVGVVSSTTVFDAASGPALLTVIV